MPNKQYSSHYVLLPDGHLGKWPVVKCSPDGTIISVEISPKGFQERPGLEFHGGLMVPGFIDVTYIPEPSKNQFNTNLHFAKGTILLGDNNATDQAIKPPFITQCIREQKLPHQCLNRLNEKHTTPIFDRAKEAAKNPENKKLAETLYLITQWGAEKTPFKKTLGQIAPDFNPGLLIIQNINWDNLQIQQSSKIKWLVLPKII